MGLSVGLICKSPSARHNQMAEGGVAATLGNVEPKDNWKVHFRDTMKAAATSIIGAWRSCTRRRRPPA